MISEKKQLTTESINRFYDYYEELVETLQDKDLDRIEKLKKAQKLKNRLGVEFGLFLESIPKAEAYGSETLHESRIEIIERLDITNHEEMMLVDLMLSSYYRALNLEKEVNRILYPTETKFSIDSFKLRVIDRLYKAIEKANNQYIRALTTLYNIKRPQPTINIKNGNTVFGRQEINPSI